MTTSAPSLRALGVPVTQTMLDAALSAAERESLNHLEFLHRLLAGPAEGARAASGRPSDCAAKFRELTSLEGFDWEFNAKGIDRRTIEQLATCDFVRRRENVVLVGQSGLGKSRNPASDWAGCLYGGLQRPLCDERQVASGVHRGDGRRVLRQDAGC